MRNPRNAQSPTRFDELDGDFRGAMNSTAKGVFITTSHHTRAAIDDARNPMKPSIALVDGTRLATIIVRSDVNITDYLEGE